MTLPALAAVPARAEGVELLGDLAGSGYRDAPALVRRADRQTLQLTPLLAHLLDLVDGRRDHDLLAAELSERVGKQAEPDDVRVLLGKLAELGLLAGADGAQPAAVAKANPLLALRCKVVVSDPSVTERLTAPFARLFRGGVVVPVLLAFGATCWWVLVEKGLASATRSAFYDPELLLFVLGLTVLSAGFHEFGHAAACRYGGATPGAMGAGLYLVFPAFYTDVDDSYRLSRWGRLRVDLGGLYFNALVAVAVTAAWLVTREDALLLGVATQLLQMLRQLAPVIRADGYHILADLTGVPDLFAHIRPTLAALVPWRRSAPTPLKPWARVVVTAWVLVVVPLLLAVGVGAVLLFPRLVATAWDSAGVQVARLSDGLAAGDVLVALVGAVKVVALALPVAALTYLLVSTVRRVALSAWTATRGRPRARTGLLVLTAVLLAALAWSWQPGSGRYVPVQQGERGTLPGLTGLASRPAVPVALPGRSGTPRPAVALVPRDRTAPVLLLTRASADAPLQAVLAAAPGQEGERVPGRALPFVLPDAPGAGDNQALATGTVDGGTVYDVAYALVWVEDGAAVTARNEAYALAGCRACTTVAVAFQVVLVVGQSDVQVPVNTAVAANGGCVECVTRALAVQLVATLQAAPTEEVRRQVQEAFSRVSGIDLAADVDTLLAEVEAVEAAVLDVLVRAGLVDVPTAAPTTAPTARPTTAPATQPLTPAPTSSPSPGAPPPTGSAGPGEAPTPTPTGDGSLAEAEGTGAAPEGGTAEPTGDPGGADGVEGQQPAPDGEATPQPPSG